MRLSIEKELLNKVVGYLGKQPFEEVFMMIQDIQKDAKPIDDATKYPTDEIVKDKE